MTMHTNPIAARDRLVNRLDRLGPGEKLFAIRAEVARCGGVIDQPNPHDGFALSLHGVYVIGTTEGDAIRLWHCTARNQMGGRQTVSMDPALRQAQIEWASWALHHQLHVSRETLAAACRAIRALSHNAHLLHRADEIAQVQNLYPLGR